MITHETPLHALASGCIWPLGREHACDLAQIREFERALSNAQDAATVAA